MTIQSRVARKLLDELEPKWISITDFNSTKYWYIIYYRHLRHIRHLYAVGLWSLAGKIAKQYRDNLKNAPSYRQHAYSNALRSFYLSTREY